MKVCSVCGRGFSEEVMYVFSPGGLRKVYECPECHDRACNCIDAKHFARSMKIRQASRTNAG